MCSRAAPLEMRFYPHIRRDGGCRIARSHAGHGMTFDRRSLAEGISRHLGAHRERLIRQWQESGPIRHFVLDDVLPTEQALQIHQSFPDPASMTLKRSLREVKYVAAQMDKYDPSLEEAVYAFQMPHVVQCIAEITGLPTLEPDEHLYAGGISLMSPGHFLNPHIDNSHDKFRRRYRALNLLYYVSPGRTLDQGGNLELWQSGPRGEPITIASLFNRLVVMFTHRHSWHSVSRNLASTDRCCVSNYFFSRQSLEERDYYHVTEFRGRPEQPLRDCFLRADNRLRTWVRTKLPNTFRNPHYYERQGNRTD